MGRYLKNTKFRSAGHVLGVPIGSNTLVTESPVDGLLRYNTSNSTLEFYSGGVWVSVLLSSGSPIVKDSFVGNGITDVFGPMSYSYSSGNEARAMVFVNTVFQDPGVDFTFDGSTDITFSTVPPNNADIVVLHGYAS
jgi:hypothetical protein